MFLHGVVLFLCSSFRDSGPTFPLAKPWNMLSISAVTFQLSAYVIRFQISPCNEERYYVPLSGVAVLKHASYMIW